MKTLKILFLFSFLMLNSMLFAQTQWRVVYQYKKVDTEESKKRADSMMKARPEFAEMFNKFSKQAANKIYIMHLNKNESVFKEEEKLDKPLPSRGIRFMQDAGKLLYKNLSENTFMLLRNSFNEIYRISDTLPNYHWKITKNSKPIGQYIAIQAIGETFVKRRDGKQNKVEVMAWFTPQIPIGNGPEKYSGLPGLILELKADRDVYLAKEIIVNPKDKIDIKAPTEGKIVSQEDFDKQVAEQIKKMREMRKSYRKRRNGRHR